MAVACVKLKLATLPNIVIRGGSGKSAISKDGAFCGNSFTLKGVNFCPRELDLRQTLPCNPDTRSPS